MVVEEELLRLGDPSGHQDAKYWNKWFKVVCGEKHQSFEWYCGTKELYKVLKHHGVSDTDVRDPRMIHPGSGNSLVPIELRDSFYLPHRHVIVDISDVALLEMQQVHDATSSSSSAAEDHARVIDYMVGDVLQPPLPIDADSFHVWLDKGLLDALFDNAESENARLCSELFDEAHRVLLPDQGMMLIVSLAEDHSLRLIVDNWTRQGPRAMWKPTLHVWELEPVSGAMRPFAFVMVKSGKAPTLEGTKDKEMRAGFSLVWHNVGGETSTHSIDDSNDVFRVVKIRVDESRHNFQSGRVTGSFVKSEVPRYVLVTLEIKPRDTEVDLSDLGRRVVESRFGRQLHPQWRNIQGKGHQESSKGEVVPIGYGISKLLLRCVIDSEDLGDLIECLMDWGGGDEEDAIQSVDVDWESAVQVAFLEPCRTNA